MAKDKKKVVIGLGLVGLISVAIYAATRPAKAAAKIPLYTGWNEVVYTGKEQTAEEAFASIMDYFEIAYYLDEELAWHLVLVDYIMVPGEIYSIKVTQDCIWTF